MVGDWDTRRSETVERDAFFAVTTGVISLHTVLESSGNSRGTSRDTGSAVTLVHQQISDKTQRNLKLSLVGEPVVSANGQPLEIKGKCDLHICVNGV